MRVLFVFSVLIWSVAGAAFAADRVALVIGNSRYTNATPLANPENDARAIADKLRELGFEVFHHENLKGQEFRMALGAFTEEALRAELAVVFYAGHGIEMGGQNYLIPIDAQMRSEATAQFETISLDQVLSTVRQAGKLGMVMLDACRDNPFATAMPRSNGTRAVSRGLAPISVEGENGILVSFAAQEGNTADDGEGLHSPYTTALLDVMDEPGVEVGRMFRKVRARVRETTSGRQIPIERMQLPDEAIYLRPGGQQPEPTPATVPVTPKPVPVTEDPLFAYIAAIQSGKRGPLEDFVNRYPTHAKAGEARQLILSFADREFWETTKAQNSVNAYRTYMLAFSSGQHVAEAASRIAALEKAAMPVTPVVVPRPTPVPTTPSPSTGSISTQCVAQNGNWSVVSIRTNDTLFVRSGPGTKYSKVGELPFNANGVSNVSCQSSGWCQVTYGCIRGYAFGKYLRNGLTNHTGSAYQGFYSVTDHPLDSKLNVRAGPGTQYKVVAELPPTASGVQVSDCQEASKYRYRWCTVSWQGISGWAYGRYLQNASGRKPT